MRIESSLVSDATEHQIGMLDVDGGADFGPEPTVLSFVWAAMAKKRRRPGL